MDTHMDRPEQSEALPQKVLIISLRGAQLLIGRQYHDRLSLARIFDLEAKANELVLLDPEAEEAPVQDNFFILTADYYTIVTESDIDKDSEEEVEIPIEEKAHHMMKVDAIRKKFLQDHWVPVHPWLYSFTPQFLSETFLLQATVGY